jgi:hypothetical protein
MPLHNVAARTLHPLHRYRRDITDALRPFYADDGSLGSRIACAIEYALRLAVARRAVILTIPSLEALVELCRWCLVLNSHADDDLPS